MSTIEDSSVLGWLVVLAYLAAAVLAALVAWRARRIFGPERAWLHQLIWAGLAGLMLLFAINKQLDLQTDFTIAIKTLAAEQGWYEYGQRLQVWFIAGLTLAGLLVLLVLIWALRAHMRQYWLLLLGALFLGRFILVRAATFYGVALYPLSKFTGGLQINGLLEIAGGVIICLGALQNLRVFRNIT